MIKVLTRIAVALETIISMLQQAMAEDQEWKEEMKAMKGSLAEKPSTPSAGLRV